MSKLSSKQLEFQLTSDKEFLLHFILQVGGNAVLDRLIEMGHSYVTDHDDAFELISGWINEGENQSVLEALDVPFNPDNLSNEYYTAMYQAADSIQKKTQTGTRLSVLGSEVDANNILGALAGGLTGFMQANNPQPMMQQNPYGYNPYNDPNRKQDNTMTWILGGLGVVVVGVILYMVFKK